MFIVKMFKNKQNTKKMLYCISTIVIKIEIRQVQFFSMSCDEITLE